VVQFQRVLDVATYTVSFRTVMSGEEGSLVEELKKKNDELHELVYHYYRDRENWSKQGYLKYVVCAFLTSILDRKRRNQKEVERE